MQVRRVTIITGCWLISAAICGCLSAGRSGSAQKVRASADPKVHAAHVGLLFESQGNTEMAMHTYERAAEKFPEDPQFSARLRKLKASSSQGSGLHASTEPVETNVQEIFNSFDRIHTPQTAKLDAPAVRRKLAQQSGQPITASVDESQRRAAVSPGIAPITVPRHKPEQQQQNSRRGSPDSLVYEQERPIPSPAAQQTSNRPTRTGPTSTQHTGAAHTTTRQVSPASSHGAGTDQGKRTAISASHLTVGSQSLLPDDEASHESAGEHLVGRTTLIP